MNRIPPSLLWYVSDSWSDFACVGTFFCGQGNDYKSFTCGLKINGLKICGWGDCMRATEDEPASPTG